MGIVFAKIIRTKQRAQAIVFSRRAVICNQDGLLCLMFRLVDRHRSRVIGARLRATLVRSTCSTTEGHDISLKHLPLNVICYTTSFSLVQCPLCNCINITDSSIFRVVVVLARHCRPFNHGRISSLRHFCRQIGA